MSLLERVYSFHQDLLSDRYPNATTLVERFEISSATARRDIAYLRDRLMAPLAFDNRRNGFYYTEDGFTLPFADSPKVTLLLGLLNRFAQEAGLRGLPEVVQLEKKLSAMLSDDHTRLMQSLYCEWIEVESVDPAVFRVIIEALAAQRTIAIDYLSTGASLSQRVIEPQRLCHYQGRWYLLAHCRLRGELRMFHLGRVDRAELGSDAFVFQPDLEQSYLQRSFGIFKGATVQSAEILFTGTAAELVRHQHWHHDQRFTATDEGLVMQLPVSDEREIAMKVLQYGSMAKVLAPASLRQRLAREIRAMTSLYDS